jgi:hypothetical protein
MAYMSQEKKAIIAAALKKVVPRDWKYSLSVHHHSSLTMRIRSAPVDLYRLHKQHENWSGGYIQLNEYYLETQYDEPVLGILRKIREAMNTGNWDKSDIQSDYFNVGHYAYIHIGEFEKPFVCTGKPEPTREELQAKIAELEARQ